MKIVHIYKIETYKYFFTTICDDVNSTKKDNEYIGKLEIDNSVEALSLQILTITGKISDELTKNTNQFVESKFTIIETNFDDFLSNFEIELKKNFMNFLCQGDKFYYAKNTHDSLSNVWDINIVFDKKIVNFVTIKSQNISNCSVIFSLKQQLPTINSVFTLNTLLHNFDEHELEIYIIDFPISTNVYQSMRRRGSCMTTIREYHIPKLGISYNFYNGVNILFGDIIKNRYIENLWDDEFSSKKHVNIIKTKINGETFQNTLNALKSYTYFQSQTCNLFREKEIKDHTIV